MPTQDEIRAAVDAIQRLRTPPLPGPRQREELLAQVAGVLRQLRSEPMLETKTDELNAEIELSDDPIIGFMLER